MWERIGIWWRRYCSLGARGERAAARMLRRSGYRIHGCNLRLKLGEIDILAEDRSNGQIVVVEVKTASREIPPPEMHVDFRKQRKLSALAARIIRRLPAGKRSIRFDVVGVVWPEGSKKPSRITHHKAAFETTL